MLLRNPQGKKTTNLMSLQTAFPANFKTTQRHVLITEANFE